MLYTAVSQLGMCACCTSLRHHHMLIDAEGDGGIVVRAYKEGLQPGHVLAPRLLFPLALPGPCLHLQLIQQSILQQCSY